MVEPATVESMTNAFADSDARNALMLSDVGHRNVSVQYGDTASNPNILPMHARQPFYPDAPPPAEADSREILEYTDTLGNAVRATLSSFPPPNKEYSLPTGNDQIMRAQGRSVVERRKKEVVQSPNPAQPRSTQDVAQLRNQLSRQARRDNYFNRNNTMPPAERDTRRNDYDGLNPKLRWAPPLPPTSRGKAAGTPKASMPTPAGVHRARCQTTESEEARAFARTSHAHANVRTFRPRAHVSNETARAQEHPHFPTGFTSQRQSLPSHAMALPHDKTAIVDLGHATGASLARGYHASPRGYHGNREHTTLNPIARVISTLATKIQTVIVGGRDDQSIHYETPHAPSARVGQRVHQDASLSASDALASAAPALHPSTVGQALAAETVISDGDATRLERVTEFRPIAKAPHAETHTTDADDVEVASILADRPGRTIGGQPIPEFRESETDAHVGSEPTHERLTAARPVRASIAVSLSDDTRVHEPRGGHETHEAVAGTYDGPVPMRVHAWRRGLPQGPSRNQAAHDKVSVGTNGRTSFQKYSREESAHSYFTPAVESAQQLSEERVVRMRNERPSSAPTVPLNATITLGARGGMHDLDRNKTYFQRPSVIPRAIQSHATARNASEVQTSGVMPSAAMYSSTSRVLPTVQQIRA